MCIPYIEPSPTRKPNNVERPTRKSHHAAIPTYGGNQGYGGYRGMRDTAQGTEYGFNPFAVRAPGFGQLPHNGQYQVAPQWPPFNQSVTSHGIHTPYGQPYMTVPPMIYTIPQERRDLLSPNWAGQSIQNSGSMELYRPSGREQRHHASNLAPLVILHTSDGRGRSRHRGGGRRHRYDTRGASRYHDGWRDSSSVDSSLYGYQRPRYRRSLSM